MIAPSRRNPVDVSLIAVCIAATLFSSSPIPAQTPSSKYADRLNPHESRSGATSRIQAQSGPSNTTPARPPVRAAVHGTNQPSTSTDSAPARSLAAKPGTTEELSAKKPAAASPAPVIVEVLPGTGQQGQQNLTIRITGKDTHFAQGTTEASFGAGVIVGDGPLSGFGRVTVLSPTTATAQISINICAVTESRIVTVRTGSEVVQLPAGFLVTSATFWTQLSPAGVRPVGRDQHTVVYDVSSDRLITFGGVANNGTLLNDVWVLAHANGTAGSPVWTQLNPTGAAPSPRKAHSAIYDAANNRMIVFGGDTSAPGAAISLANDVWVLTNANGLGGTPAWTQLAPQGLAPPARRASAVHYDPASNRLIVFGGLTGNLTALNDTWVLSNANGLGGTPAWTQFSPAGPLPGARQSAYSAYDPQTNRLTIFGGTAGQDCAPGVQIYNDVWALTNANGLSGTPGWVPLTPAGINGFPGPRQQGVRTSAAALSAGTNRFAVVGGEMGPDCSLTGEIWLLVNANGNGIQSWVRSSPLNSIPLEARAGALGYDSITDRLIAFGGAGSNETFVLTNLTNVSEPEPNPSLVSVLPNLGHGGQTLDITLLGQCTDFSQRLTQADFGSDLTVNRVTVSSVTRATANVTIPDGVYAGPRDVSATTGLEVARLRGGFSVAPANLPPTVSAGPDQTLTFGTTATGKIVVTNDEWQLTNTGFGSTPAGSTRFALNVAQWFSGSSNQGSFLVYSSNFGLDPAQATTLAATMRGAGYTWTSYTSIPGFKLSLASLKQYQGIFLACPEVPDNNLLINYVTSGGNVYLEGGTGSCGGSQAEAASWKPFLNAFGLAFDNSYNGIGGAISITNPLNSPILAGVTFLYQNNGNSIESLGTTPNARIIESLNGQGLYATFYNPAGTSAQATLSGTITDDGLPAGANLQATWNEVSGPSAVSFGTPSFSFPDVSGVVYPATTTVSFSQAGTYVLRLTASDSLLSASSDVTITVNSPAPPGVSSVVPSFGRQGQTNLAVTITCQNTHFAQGTTQVSFGSDVVVNSVAVSSATSLTANIGISATANLGPHTVTVTTGAEVLSVPGGFTVTPRVNQPPVVSAGSPQTISSAGRIVVGHDVNTLGSFVAGTNENQFAVNLARWLTGATSGTILAVESSPGDGSRDYAPSVKAALASGGYAVTYVSNPLSVSALTLADLQAYNAIFVGITWPTPASISSSVLTQYVNAGGNVYVYGGVDENASAEAAFLNPFLQVFGLAFDTTNYNGLNSVNITSIHPIFNGLPGKTLGSGNGQDIHDLGTNANASIIQFQDQHGVYAVVNAATLTLNGSISDDGLPAGATLTATWSAINGPGPVSFSNPTSSFPDVAGKVNPVLTSAAFGIPGVYTLRLTGNDSQLSNSADVIITVLQTGEPAITSVQPSSGAQGLTLSVAITGTNTHFGQGTSQISFGPGIAVSSVSAVSPTQLIAAIMIALDAPCGPRTITVNTGGEVASGTNQFTVTCVAALISVSPNSGQQGQTNLSVNVTGQNTHFVQGTTTASFGAGLTVASLTVNSPTTATAVLNIDAAAAIGLRTVTFTTGSETATAAAGFLVTMPVSGPTITTVSPNSGQEGKGGPVTIIGLNTHFVQGSTQVDFGPGITVSNVQVSCPTCLMAQLAVDAAAPIGPHTVTVTTGSEVAALVGGFTVLPGTPMIISLVPASGQQGQSLQIMITGKFTHFAQGATQVSFGTGVTVSNINVSGPTTLTAQLAIDPAAVPGTRTLTVTTGTEVVSPGAVFTVLQGVLVLSMVNPGGAQQGDSLPVTITGQLTHFAQGTSQVSFGAGISVGPVTVASATSLTAQITVANDAAPGPRTVTVTTGTETASLMNGFTVKGKPIILSLDPGGAAQGNSPVVSIVGLFTNFVQGTTQASFGAGISVGGGPLGGFGPVTVSSPTTATAQISIDAAAPLGLRTVVAQTGSEQASFANGFTVVPPPIVSSIAPNSGLPGQTFTVAITGKDTHFVAGVSQVSFDQYITVTAGSVTVADATHLTAQINIASNALPGPRTVLVTTNAAIKEVAPLNGGFTINSPGSLLSVGPSTGQQGQQNLMITITGQGTHFVQGTTQVSFGAGVTVGSVTVNSPTSAIASISIDPSAATGPRTVTVTTGPEVESLNNGFNVAMPPTLTSVSPNMGQQGQQNLLVTVAGQSTHFLQGPTQVTFGAGITVTSVTVNSSTSLIASINIDSTAADGTRNVTVTTGSETATLALGFTVQRLASGPVSVNPASGSQGQSIPVVITGTGTHFVQGTTMARFGPGISVGAAIAGDFGPVRVSSPTTATAQIMIVSNALPGSRTITVQTGAEQDVGTNGFLIVGVPYISAITPVGGHLGDSGTVVITGTYTHFAQGATQVSFGAGVTVNSVTVNNPANLVAAITIGTTATLGPRNVTVQTGTEQVTAANGFSVFGTITGAPPVPSITSPPEGTIITAPAQVTGTVTSPNLDNWTLEFQGPGSTVFTQFATGTTSSVTGTLDPTMLLNGNAVIRLTGLDTSGQAAAITETVVIARNLKVGNFTVSFNDLSIPVAGLPIQVIRTYDSRNQQVGDFGVGWTLDLKTIRLNTNGALGDNWTGTVSGGVIKNYCIQPVKPHVVTIAFSDGTTYEFQPVLSPNSGCQQIAPLDQVTVTFAPTGITPPNAFLTPVGNNQPFVFGTFPGPITLLDLDNVSTYDPDQYSLTLPDGRVAQISRQSGLQSLTDLNGNKLTVSSSGITHSSGKSVSFLRDGQGRITQITDPAGNKLLYAYNAAGDLASFTDQINNVSTYTYNSTHGLLTITDPRGIQPIRNDYDVNGRLVSHTDAFGNVINYTHDLNSRQEIVTDRLGNITVNEYDTDGNIVKVTDALGGITSRSYDSHGNLLSETNALTQTRSYTYDQNNNRLTETDPLSNKTTYTYNERNQVLTITDALNRVTTNIYDGNGNLTSTKDPAANTTIYTYNAQGLRTSITDPLLGVTSYVYDSSGNITQQTDTLNHVTTYTYDANDNRLTETRTRTISSGSETLVTSYQYDKLNRLIQTTYPDGSTTQIAYNAIGKQSVTTDQLNRQTSYQYDLMGRLIQTTYPDGTSEFSSYDAEGERITSTDRAGRTTTYTYDPLKRLTKTTYPDGATTSTAYDAIGQVTSVTDPRGNLTQYQYDNAGRRTKVIDALSHATSFAYDQVGNQTSMIDANNNTTQYQYDANNRRIKVLYADATSETTTYDALGRTIAKIDQAGLTTQFVYDSLGRLTQVTDALGQLTKYAYDEVGSRVSQTDANNHATTFTYDKLGRRTKRALPLGMSESYTYDVAGDLKTKTDFNGKTTTYTYDAVNRLTSKVPDPSFAAPTVTFTYTATGQRSAMVDASGTTSYAYDLRDRLVQKVTPEGTLTYTYDLAANLTSILSSNVNGASVSYAYDVLNRLSQAQDNRPGSGTTTYAYDNVGSVRGYTYPNGVQSTHTYNSLNRLTNLTIAKGATLASYAYTLGAAGNRTQAVEFGNRQVGYTYDNLYRLTAETITGGTVSGTIGYQYDAVGNRLQRTSSVASVPAASYTYDANDRLTTDAYDLSGNTTASGGNTYTYDFENHLKTQNGGAVAIVYDGDGNRVAKTAAGLTTQYLIDERNLTGYAQVLEEISAGAVQRVYTYGLNRISQSQASGISFYGYDGHGSVRLLTDATGAVTDRYDYDAFGNIVSQTGSTPNVYLYSGEQIDPNLGFYYLRARYLNPGTGRFFTSDPFPANGSDPKSLHRYLYANADPTNRRDPSGMLSLVEVSVTLTINSILSVYQDKLLFPILFQSIQCAECVIAPANQMYNMALNALADGAGSWAQDLLWHAQTQQVQGYRAIGGIIAQNYAGFFTSLVKDTFNLQADYGSPSLKILLDEVFSAFPGVAAAAGAGRVVNRGTVWIGKLSGFLDGVAEAYGYWSANKQSGCGKAMLFNALGTEIIQHIPDFGAVDITDKYSYTVDGMTDDQYRQYVRSVIQQIKGQ